MLNFEITMHYAFKQYSIHATQNHFHISCLFKAEIGVANMSHLGGGAGASVGSSKSEKLSLSIERIRRKIIHSSRISEWRLENIFLYLGRYSFTNI